MRNRALSLLCRRSESLKPTNESRVSRTRRPDWCTDVPTQSSGRSITFTPSLPTHPQLSQSCVLLAIRRPLRQLLPSSNFKQEGRRPAASAAIELRPVISSRRWSMGDKVLAKVAAGDVDRLRKEAERKKDLRHNVRAMKEKVQASTLGVLRFFPIAQTQLLLHLLSHFVPLFVYFTSRHINNWLVRAGGGVQGEPSVPCRGEGAGAGIAHGDCPAPLRARGACVCIFGLSCLFKTSFHLSRHRFKFQDIVSSFVFGERCMSKLLKRTKTEEL
mmetsp:Transcript_28170/g.74372  ORF Transcript_28170/g.74372 Transcript_28170/m.74372 type:complete len:273 (+) Transcript_28170:398-1216(+)